MDRNFESDWFAFQRIQEIEAAKRVNLIRVIAILVFFGIVLFRYLNSEKSDADYDYIWRSGRVCGTWMMLAGAIAFGLYNRTFPSLIKYLSALCDTALLTAVAGIGERAESTLVVIYFVIIACSFLTFAKPFIFFTTGICIVAYSVLAFETPAWKEGTFPFVEVFRMVAGMVVMGLAGGQICRGCRKGIQQIFDRPEKENE